MSIKTSHCNKFFNSLKQQFSKIFCKEDKNKNYRYKTGNVVFSFVLMCMSGYSTLRDNERIRKITKISSSQLDKRTKIIRLEKLRLFLFRTFLNQKRKDGFRKAILIIDKTNFELPEYIKYGKWYIKDYNQPEQKTWGVEYSFACTYFPDSDQTILLDWEKVQKDEGESDASKRMMERLKRKFYKYKARVHLIIADRLYFQHYYFEEWSRQIAEGFLTIPKRNSLIRKNGLGLLNQIGLKSNKFPNINLLDKEFYRGKTKIKDNYYQIWEVDKIYWPDNNDNRKYVTEKEKKGRKIRLVIARNCETGEFLYTVSNSTHICSAIELFLSYKLRWSIEKFFQNSKERFGNLFLTENENTFEIRMILKLIGIYNFFLYMRFRRDKLNNNLGLKIAYFLQKYLFELLNNVRVYNNGKIVHYSGFT